MERRYVAFSVSGIICRLFVFGKPAKMQRAYVSELRTTVEKLAEKISKDEADLKAAREARATEHAAFVAKTKEPKETVVVLKRATEILERELAKASIDTLDDLASTTELLHNTAFDTLAKVTEKAEHELAEARKNETIASNKFQMVEQALKDEIKFAKKDLAEAKKGLEECRAKRHRTT